MRYLRKTQINDNDIIAYNVAGNISDEFIDYIVKNTIVGLIDEIPIETVKKLFNVTVERLNHPNGKITEITASLNINE